MKLQKIDKDPSIIINKNSIYFLNPDYVYLPFKISKSNIKQNVSVLKYQNIFDNIESSISGKVLGISKINKKDYLAIENDYREKKIKDEYIRNNITINTILSSLENKNEFLFSKFKSLKSCENIVINIIEDEPYSLNKIIYLKEHINDVLDIIDKLSLIYKSSNNFLTIKSSDSEIIDNCLNKIGTYPNINLSLLENEYLLGKEDYLLNKLKLDKNSTLYVDIINFIKLIDLIKYRKISSTKIITISGNAIEEGKILRIKKYTQLKDIVNKYVKIITDEYDIYINNLLQGITSDINLIVDDNINSIHIMKKTNFSEESCINCGRCFNVCPKGIDVISFINKKKESKECLDCGLCTYVCPSYINLRNYLLGEYHE